MRQFVALFTFIIVIHGIGSEILQITDKDGAWYCQSASADCTMIVDGDDTSGSEYHCPSNPNSCDLCELICNGNKNGACKDTAFYSYSCKQVNIITNSSDTPDSILSLMTIYGPNNGNLNVTIGMTGNDAFKTSKIYSNNTKNIFFNLNENDATNIAADVEIYGRNIQDTIKLNLFGNAKNLQLYCPISRGTKCIVNCVGNISNKKCKDMIVYTKFGFGNNLQLRTSSKKRKKTKKKQISKPEICLLV